MIENLIQILKNSNVIQGSLGASLRATKNQVLSDTNEVYVTPQSIGQSMAFQTISIGTNSEVVLDIAKGYNAVLTLSSNSRLSQPLNAVAGISGLIQVKQDSYGSKNLSFSGFWNFGFDGPPTITPSPFGEGYILYTIAGDSLSAICRYIAGDNSKNTDVDDIFKTSLYITKSSMGRNSTPFAPDMAIHACRSQNSSIYFTNSVKPNLAVTQNADAQISLASFAQVTETGVNNNIYSTNSLAVNWAFKRKPRFFDMVSYTGSSDPRRTIPHNLRVRPGMVLIKPYSSSGDWIVSHRALEDIGLNRTLALNTSNPFNDGKYFNKVSDEKNLYLNTFSNRYGVDYMAYIFAHDTLNSGNIKCGEYTGSATVSLGWKPQWLLVKSYSHTGNWLVFDDKRANSSTMSYIVLNVPDVEVSTSAVTFTSDGFTISGGDSNSGATGRNYIYMAIRDGIL